MLILVIKTQKQQNIMENRESKNVIMLSGINDNLTGAFVGFTIQKNGILRIRKMKIKRPNQYDKKKKDA